jgi:hypothetical protein
VDDFSILILPPLYWQGMVRQEDLAEVAARARALEGEVLSARMERDLLQARLTRCQELLHQALGEGPGTTCHSGQGSQGSLGRSGPGL